MKNRTNKLAFSTISTISVLAATTIFLSYVNIQNQNGIGIIVEEIPSTGSTQEAYFENQTFVFQDQPEFELLGQLPDQNTKVEFWKYIVGAYIGTPQPNPGYSYKVTKTSRQNDTIEVTYKIVTPDRNKIYSDVISYPVLLVKIKRADLASTSTHVLKFINQDTKDTAQIKFDIK